MSQEWVTVSSFAAPPQQEEAFEAIVSADLERWNEEARRVGLDPRAHVRVTRDGDAVTVDVSRELDAAFTPVQTLWRAD